MDEWLIPVRGRKQQKINLRHSVVAKVRRLLKTSGLSRKDTEAKVQGIPPAKDERA